MDSEGLDAFLIQGFELWPPNLQAQEEAGWWHMYACGIHSSGLLKKVFSLTLNLFSAIYISNFKFLSFIYKEYFHFLFIGLYAKVKIEKFQVR